MRRGAKSGSTIAFWGCRSIAISGGSSLRLPSSVLLSNRPSPNTFGRHRRTGRNLYLSSLSCRVRSLRRAYSTTQPQPQGGAKGTPTAKSGGGAPSFPSGKRSNIYEVDEPSFKVAVIDESRQRPVIMDCYANWCGPCKKLTPMLEGAVTQAGGKIALAKVNADKCPNLMKQLGVNSLPTVFAVSDGQLVDSFSGVPTPDGLNKWISRILEEGGKVTATEDMAEVLEIAEQELSSGNIAAATSSFNEILQSPAKDLHHLAIAGLARCALEENNLEVARSLVKTLKENYKDKLSQPAVGKAISSVELRSEFEAKSGGASVKNKLKEYKDKVAQNPNDQEAMYNFAFTLFAAGKTEEAIEQLLDMIKKDRTWNDGAARKLLLRMFEALGQNNELTVNARKKFANIWFCG